MKEMVYQNVRFSFVINKGKKFQVFFVLVMLSGTVCSETDVMSSTGTKNIEMDLVEKIETETFSLQNYHSDKGETTCTYIWNLLTGYDFLPSTTPLPCQIKVQIMIETTANMLVPYRYSNLIYFSQALSEHQALHRMHIENDNILLSNELLEENDPVADIYSSFEPTHSLSYYNRSTESTVVQYQSYAFTALFESFSHRYSNFGLLLKLLKYKDANPMQCMETQSHKVHASINGNLCLAIPLNPFLSSHVVLNESASEASNSRLCWYVYLSTTMDAMRTREFSGDVSMQYFLSEGGKVDHSALTSHAQYFWTFVNKEVSIDFGNTGILNLLEKHPSGCKEPLSMEFTIYFQKHRSQQYLSSREITKENLQCALDIVLSVVFVQNIYLFVYQLHNEPCDLIYKDGMNSISPEVRGTLIFRRDNFLIETNKTNVISVHSSSSINDLANSEHKSCHSKQVFVYKFTLGSVIHTIESIIFATINFRIGPRYCIKKRRGFLSENVINGVCSIHYATCNSQTNVPILKKVEMITSFDPMKLSTTSYCTAILRIALTRTLKLIRGLWFHVFQHQSVRKLYRVAVVETSASMIEKVQIYICNFGLGICIDSFVKTKNQSFKRYVKCVPCISQEYAVYVNYNGKTNNQQWDGNILRFSGNHPKAPNHKIAIYYNAYFFTFDDWHISLDYRLHQHNDLFCRTRIYQVGRHVGIKYDKFTSGGLWVKTHALNNSFFSNSSLLVICLLQLNEYDYVNITRVGINANPLHIPTQHVCLRQRLDNRMADDRDTILKIFSGWWLLHMKSWDYNDTFIEILTRYELCIGCGIILRFPRTHNFTESWKVMLIFSIRIHRIYRIKYVNNDIILDHQITSFLLCLSDLKSPKHLQCCLLKSDHTKTLFVYFYSVQNSPLRCGRSSYDEMHNNNKSYRCSVHKLTERIMNHLQIHLRCFPNGFRVNDTCNVNLSVFPSYDICLLSAVLIPPWLDYQQGMRKCSWDYTKWFLISQMQPLENVVMSFQNISDVYSSIARSMFKLYRSRTKYLQNRRTNIVIMMSINMKKYFSVFSCKWDIQENSDHKRDAKPFRVSVLRRTHSPTFINETINEENETNIYFQRIRSYKVVRHCYVLNMTACNCASSSEKGNTTVEYIKIIFLKIFCSRYNAIRECLILIFVLLRWLKTNVFNICYQGYPKYKIHIKHYSKCRWSSSRNNYTKRFNRFCKRSNVQRSKLLRKPHKHKISNAPSILSASLDGDEYSVLEELFLAQCDPFSTFNNHSLFKNHDRPFLLSLGNTHQQVNAYTFPVYQSTLDKHFESSLDNSSIDSSLGIELLRVGTFHNFPGTNAPSSLTLAKAGFFFTGEADIVECFHCHMRYNTSGANDDPFVVHRRLSPSCAFINGHTNSNVPVPRCGENAGAVGGQTPLQTQNGSKPLLQKASGHSVSESYRATQSSSEGICQSGINLSTKRTSQFQAHPLPAQYQNQSQSQGSSYHNGLTNGFTPKSQTLAQSSCTASNGESRNAAKGIGHVTTSEGLITANTHLAQNNENQQKIGNLQTISTAPAHSGLVNGTNNPSPFHDRRKTEQQIRTSGQWTMENGQGQPSNSTALPTNIGLVNGTNEQTLRCKNSAQQQIGMSGQLMNNMLGQSTHRTTEAEHQPLKLEPLGIVAASPRYPAYAVLSVRMSTFNGWPSTSGQTPRQMATAGFIFAGYSDYTRCFFCGGGLRNWEPEDDPWIEHAKWFPKCVYLRQNKGDSFVQLVHHSLQNPDILQASEINVVNGENIPATAPPAAVQSRSGPGMSTENAAIQSVQEMGYNRPIIDSAIAILRSDGKEVDAYNIMDVILSSDLEQSSPTPSPGQFQNLLTNHDTEQTSHEEQPEASGSSVDLTTLQLQEMGLSDIKSLMEENKSLKESRLCKVCLDNESSIAFVPCGHLVCCAECAFAMRKCPICRKQIEGRVKTWMG